MNQEKQFPENKFTISGFSDDPEIRKKEFEKIREKVFAIQEQQNMVSDRINDNNFAYYKMQDGRIFKRNTENNLFYMLNRETNSWDFFPPLQSIFYDSSLLFEEIEFSEENFEEINKEVQRRVP